MKRSIPSIPSNSLVWPQLIPGVLIKRYKRFLADVRLENGEVVTAHCPNTGSMQGCCKQGYPVYLSYHDNPKRKLKYTWDLIAMPTSLVGINTLIPNRLVFSSIIGGLVPELCGYETIQREVSIGDHSRIDLMLDSEVNGRCYVEIKNCTLVNEGIAYFPDAVTARGLRHLNELVQLAESGFRTVMFYFIQRMDARLFRPADHIDAAYGRQLRYAVKQGIEIVVYDVFIDFEQIRLNRKIPFEL
jgi:sugar fermentation stimulation protein A